jgi:hypothetical protein
VSESESVRALSEALDVLRDVDAAPETELAKWREWGVVIDKWPVSDRTGRWTREEFDALDPEVRWQGVVFSMYTSLVQLAGYARAVIEENDHV